MIIFEDITAQSFLARLDPRVRVACVLLFAVLICLCERPLVLATGLAAAILLLILSGIPFRRAFKRLAALNGFMLLLVITLPFFFLDASAIRLGPLAWSRAGLMRALLIGARANAVMLMLTAMLGTMKATHLGFALNGIGMPAKFAHLLLFMIRYIEVIHHEYHHLRHAMLLRAFRPRFNRHTFRVFGYLVGQLLVRSLNRSERIVEAMKCRGFRGQFYVLAPCHIEPVDILFAVLALAGMSLLSIWEWM